MGLGGTTLALLQVAGAALSGGSADALRQEGSAAEGGAAEWRQGVHYTIEASLDEAAGVLRGSAVLVYRNGSPDTLRALWFHLYLNAFRPGSEWARREQRERLDFGALSGPDYGFERLREVRVDGRRTRPEWPGAPDSTVARVPLEVPLAPGDTVEVRFEWQARPSTLCRRQCRRGRQWDMAQWYPRIAAYDEGGWQAHALEPKGEFYGEFGVYDVTLELADDQVVGATGVPLEGDPGWRAAPGSPLQEIPLQRGWYADRRPRRSPGRFDEPPAAGRRRVRFYAEDVHHFAWSASPDYLWEGLRHGDVAIHVLYRPGDLDWDLGAAALRTERALAWLETVFGPYPWPQLTNLHRLEGGGTEFPMLIMDGSASQGLIVHETAHQYAHGALASNEWREAWLDEGMASFLARWFYEEHGAPDPWSAMVEATARADAGGVPVPIATVSDSYPDFSAYGRLAYTRGSTFLYALREMLGPEVMRAGLQLYWKRNRLRHVDESDLRSALEEASGRDLSGVFHRWLHTTGVLDYGIEAARTAPEGDGWRTVVEVRRDGRLRMPVEVAVGGRRVRLQGMAERERVTVRTAERPALVVLDPDGRLPDADPSDDLREPDRLDR